MADIKISELPDAGVSVDGDTMVIVRGGATQRATVQPRLMVFSFNERGNLTPGEFLRVGEVKCDDNEAWVSPIQGTVTSVTISRGDADPAEVEVLVEGVSQVVIPTTAPKQITGTGFVVNAGDSVAVRSGLASSNNMNDVVVTLLMEA